MKIPEKPESEVSRLAVLFTLGILDTPNSEKFDRITRIAKRTFNVPIALISLVDENRQWFKSCFGLSVNETSRDISFCGHAILGRDIFVIHDAKEDERFFDNPLVIGSPFIRFYAGCPINVFGSNIGTLCIIDTNKKIFSDEDKETLRDLSFLIEEEFNSMQESMIDYLTHIHNRKGFSEIVEKAIKLCRSENIVSSLCFMDLNHFKDINDKYGHDEGDRTLKEFSKLLKDEARDSDIVGRLGGDEFAIWLLNNSKESAKQFVLRLKEKVKEKNDNGEKPYAIDFAYGIIEIKPDEFLDLEEILRKADVEMYNDKGRRKR